MVATRSQAQSCAAVAGASDAQQQTLKITKSAARQAKESERARIVEINRKCYAARQQQMAIANAQYLGMMKYLGTHEQLSCIQHNHSYSQHHRLTDLALQNTTTSDPKA